MPISSKKCLLVAAHPDDETVGAGIWMKRHTGPLKLVHITDGSPIDLRDALGAGFGDRESYARARRQELYDALALARVSPEQCVELGIRDQTAYLSLSELTERLGAIVEEWRPDVVLSPAYEGGHPDHDAAAFAVAAVRERHAFRHCEYRLYHARNDGGLAVHDFIPVSGVEPEILDLTPEERRLKACMIAAFRSQARVLAQFPIIDERFRDAPEYDFRRPPHEGRLMYERWGFPVSGDQWRQQAWRYASR